MILGRFPDVLALSTEDETVLAEELLQQINLESDNDPALRELLRERLAEHETNPDGGVPWEELRDRLLKKSLSSG
jgi:putative addiction module component (TIGR02574 family)